MPDTTRHKPACKCPRCLERAKVLAEQAKAAAERRKEKARDKS